jgi:ribosome-associated protein
LDEKQEGTEESPYVSRSERKRRAEALQRLGVWLTTLRAGQLQTLQLPTELLDAVIEAKQLRSRAALARQRQYIGRLMRELDPEVLARAQAQVANSHDAKMRR